MRFLRTLLAIGLLAGGCAVSCMAFNTGPDFEAMAHAKVQSQERASGQLMDGVANDPVFAFYLTFFSLPGICGLGAMSLLEMDTTAMIDALVYYQQRAVT